MQYLVTREENSLETWEDERLIGPTCRQLIDDYNEMRAEEEEADVNKYKRHRSRKRDRKALQKGSIEKGNKARAVLGLKKSKIRGDAVGPVMCKVDWEPVRHSSSELVEPSIELNGSRDAYHSAAVELIVQE